MALYGPKPPWRIVGISSIDTQNGEACLTIEGSWVNDDVRKRICESVNLLPELVAEIERLERWNTSLQNNLNAYHTAADSMNANLDCALAEPEDPT